MNQSLLHSAKRYLTLQTHRITALPIVILMPHSSCNCRCIMCDIWKGNQHLKQLTGDDISGLLKSLKQYGTRQVVFSGGEALLHPAFFELCNILKKQKIHLTLLSTGLTIIHHAASIVNYVDDLILSLDGDAETHDKIRNIKGAFQKLKEGVAAVHELKPGFPVSTRTVIHQHNFRSWPRIIEAAKELGLKSISFLPADVSSEAFNRTIPWQADRQMEVAIGKEELPELKKMTDRVIHDFEKEINEKFISESPQKLGQIYSYYAAIHGLQNFPQKKCNAPWVSAVIEADGSVRPCFFHPSIGNIHEGELTSLLNNEAALQFRKQLDMDTNETCKRCVCSLNLPAWVNPVPKIHLS